MDDKRKHIRVEILGLSADVSDGVGFFPGLISDISRFGILMNDLPKRVDGSIAKMTVVVSGHGNNFKMMVRPRWSEDTGLHKKMGFEIINSPWKWTEFVMKLEPQDDGDVWDTIKL